MLNDQIIVSFFSHVIGVNQIMLDISANKDVCNKVKIHIQTLSYTQLLKFIGTIECKPIDLALDIHV